MTVGRLALVLSGAASVLLLAAFALGALGRPASPVSPALPPVTAEELVAEVQRADPVALAGTVRLEAAFANSVSPEVAPAGTARAGSVPSPADGLPDTARMWSDGTGRWRVSLPQPDGERALVDDGMTMWLWNSASRSLTRSPRPRTGAVGPGLLALPELPALPGEPDRALLGELVANPVATADAVLAMVGPESLARLEPTTTVAARPAYQLVLDPLPTERTVLREIRVAVDGQTRLPLEVSVLANGSTRPALRVGFTDVRFGPQDPGLFGFSPGNGVTVRRTSTGAPVAGRALGSAPPWAGDHRTTRGDAESVSVIGRGWDTVLVRRLPAPASSRGTTPRPSRLISGPWGVGRLVSTGLGNAVVTSDGRVASGAVPAQVLSQALSG
jgi:hypothetical protein